MGRPPGVSSRNSTYGRLRVALAGSALLHMVGASTLVPDASNGSARDHRESIPMVVRLEPAPVTPAVSATAQARPRPRSGPPRILPAPTDPTVYTAGELDSLPVPVAPLELASAAAVRLELTIDEHGAVHSISIAGPRAGAAEKELRAALAATLFVPARKDGRAVKSRIVLGVQ